MSFMKTWCTLEEAESKYGVTRALVMEWVDEGVVRCEMENGEVARINTDDLELMIAERTGES
ncbi:MAG TPA: MerR family transcriptional regulator [Geobacteraceae bacterium]|nr:MerR family transcriptional regulator [Geobacteraceae bacterium]